MTQASQGSNRVERRHIGVRISLRIDMFDHSASRLLLPLHPPPSLLIFLPIKQCSQSSNSVSSPSNSLSSLISSCSASLLRISKSTLAARSIRSSSRRSTSADAAASASVEISGDGDDVGDESGGGDRDEEGQREDLGDSGCDWCWREGRGF